MKMKSGSCGPFPGRFAFNAKWRKNLARGYRAIEWEISGNAFKLTKSKLQVNKEDVLDVNEFPGDSDSVHVDCLITSTTIGCRVAGQKATVIRGQFEGSSLRFNKDEQIGSFIGEVQAQK